ncbi:MAG: YceI family protein, partial [Thermoplasmata archaeon]
LDMQNDLDQITVFYPKADGETDDEAFIDFNNIPMYEKLEAKATLKVRTGAVFEVNPEGLIDMDMSSSPGEISIYYPKAVAEDPNIKFMYIPANSIPSRAEVGGEVGVTIYDIGDGIPDDPRNKIYGNIYHDCNQNIQRVDFYFPSEQATPILQMLDMPADSYAEGALQWGQLQGHVYATRGYLGNRDPIILSLSYAGYDIYNKFEIEEGHFRTGFKIGTDGYVYMDTAKKMFSNNLRVNNNDQDAPLSKLHLTIDQLSVDDLRADWDIDTSGDQLKVNHLSIGGVVDTLSGLHFDLTYQGKNTWLDFDWITGEAGHVRIDFKQDDPLQIDFSMLENLTAGTGITLDGYVELSQNPHFDVEWKWHQGERYIDPGYFRINQYSNTPNIQDMSLSLIWQDLWGAEAHVRNVGIYVCVEWYWYNLLLYIWPVIEISGTVDLDLLLNGQWYDALTYENPP